MKDANIFWSVSISRTLLVWSLMVADNIDAKFGPCPVSVPSPRTVSVLQSTLITLVIQSILCITLLMVVQPPFVLTSPKTSDGIAYVCVNRVLLVSVFTVAMTVTMYATGAQPKDTFTKSCEFLYRITKT